MPVSPKKLNINEFKQLFFSHLENIFGWGKS